MDWNVGTSRRHIRWSYPKGDAEVIKPVETVSLDWLKDKQDILEEKSTIRKENRKNNKLLRISGYPDNYRCNHNSEMEAKKAYEAIN